MNLAERLGYSADDRVLILNADDVGSTHASNAATFECLERGSLTSGSILVPAAWSPEVALYARDHPEADFGVHLTLTCEYSRYRWRPLAERSQAPGLYDEEGYLWRTSAEAIEHISPEEADLELRAQIDTAVKAGIDVTHLDTHMGTVLQPKFMEVYFSLGLDYKIPIFAFRPNPDRLRKAGMSDYWDALKPQLARLDEAGFPVLDHIIETKLAVPPQDRSAYFREFFESLRPGVTHFLVHPTYASDEVAAMTDSTPSRAQDYELFKDRSIAEQLEKLGIHTITYREIRERYRAGSLVNGV